MMIYMCNCNTMACHFRYLSGLFKVIMQATLKKVSYLENFSVYIRNTATDYYNELVNEPWPTIFTRPVILHFYAENSRLKVKRHCKGLDTVK